MARMAAIGILNEETLFQSSGLGKCFTLRPHPRSSIPLQWVHVGPGAIPDTLADIPCAELPIDILLQKLNSVLGTTHSLDSPGLGDLLIHIHGLSVDFGEAYGRLRNWWPVSGDFSSTQDQMERSRRRDDGLRREAIRDSCIQDSDVPPRRVWDLFSNRVLPFHAVPDTGDYMIPNWLWTVSHSWVDEVERTTVYTTINARQWPVPIPQGVTLAHVRTELLNMSAEYVWLDVLCLRQRGEDKDEPLRKEEWELDIPTIGATYLDSDRPVFTYFHGLGLPLDTSPDSLGSHRHWFNRVWTFQETQDSWIPCGLVGEPFVNPDALSAHMKRVLRITELPMLIQELKARYCTTELDRIASSAYWSGCLTLPLYTEDTTAEHAWVLLLKHMDPWIRTSVLLQYAVDEPFALWTTWNRYLVSEPTFPGQPSVAPVAETLALVDPDQLYTADAGQFYHSAYAVGPCRIQRGHHGASTSTALKLELLFDKDDLPASFSASGVHGILLSGVAFTLVGVGDKWKEHWIVIEKVGECSLKDGEKAKGSMDGEEAESGMDGMEVEIDTGDMGAQAQPAIEAVKWAVIRVEKNEGERLERQVNERPRTKVIYLDGEEAQRRSEHTAKYMEAFEHMQKSGETAYIG